MDVYPYVAGCTSLAWFFQRSIGAVPVDEAEALMADLCAEGFADVVVLVHRDATAIGRSIADLARARGERPGLTGQRLVVDDPGCVCLYDRVAAPAAVEQALLHPRCFVGSDGYLFSSRFAGMCH